MFLFVLSIKRWQDQKGVADEVIAGVLASLSDEYSRALDEARRKGSRGTWKSAEDVKTGLVRFLSGRGFSHDAIKAVMNELCDEGFFLRSINQLTDLATF